MKRLQFILALAIVNPAVALADATIASSAPPMPTPPILTAEQKALHGAEMASSISGDDIRTVTRYYADPSQVHVENVRIADMIGG